ncbi:MAG: hypothetical protein R3B13_27825 [Polyangiaceae bacterium]
MNPLLRLRRLSERGEDEDALRHRDARSATASDRLAQALELSDIARDLARSVGAAWVEEPGEALAAKARRHPIGK